MAERIPLADAELAASDLERLRVALESGAVVGLPTETVYGLAARADCAAGVQRLRLLKGRDPTLALTWHVGSAAALERFPVPSAMARRLAERYWPGPLTLVLPGVPAGLELAAREDWTGLRWPACEPTARLLEKLPFPLVASSANASGEPPLCDAGALEAAFGDELPFVLDAGPARLGESSVVLRMGRGRFDLLREGILDLEALRAAAGLRIGFVCTGNTCRSPMAEALAAHLTAGALEIGRERLAEFGFEFRSMGIMAGSGARASQHAVEVLARDDIDLSGHRSHPALSAEITALERVYALTSRHLEALRRLLPPGEAEHCELLDPAGADVPDPIGGPLAEYERTAAAIRGMLEARLSEWV